MSSSSSLATMEKRSQTAAAVMRTAGSNAEKESQEPTTQPAASAALEDFDAVKWELENVHDVYSSIASHFSATRYKPWPLVTDFLSSLPPGSIGVDVGCGNGKYLHLRNLLHSSGSRCEGDCITIGVDRSAELIDLAQGMTLDKMASNTSAAPDQVSATSVTDRANEVAVGDGLSTGFRSQAFDYAISIATIHHFSTRQRRREAVQELVRLVKPVTPDKEGAKGSIGGRGRFLVYVWALEQRGQERRKFDEDDARRREEEASKKTSVAEGRDVLVPWVMRNQRKSKQQEKTQKDTYSQQEEEKVYQRYYHLFEETELESLVQEAIDQMSESQDAGLRVVREDSGWERGNWWGVWKVIASEERVQ